MNGWCCTDANCLDKQWICSECYSDCIVRRKLDAKTANHHYYTTTGFTTEDAAFNEGLWYDTYHPFDPKKIDYYKTTDINTDNYVCVGFWTNKENKMVC